MLLTKINTKIFRDNFKSHLRISIGFGVVLGLVLPLLASNVFLKELSLAHGSGNIFGVLFFLSYSILLLAVALIHFFVSSISLHSKTINYLAYALVFAGNFLMLLINTPIINSISMPITIVMAVSIGIGLALLEILWIQKIVVLESENKIESEKVIPMALFFGAAIGGIIFLLSNILEIIFALTMIIISFYLYPKQNKAISTIDSLDLEYPEIADYILSVLYLIIVSFVFGIIGQVASNTLENVFKIQTLAVLGAFLSAVLLFVGVLFNKSIHDNRYLFLISFPIIAVALVLLPFSRLEIASYFMILVIFIAHFLTRAILRMTVCRLGRIYDISPVGVFSLGLGIASIVMIAGVIFGSYIVEGHDSTTNLLVITLIALFALSMYPVVIMQIDRKSKHKNAENNSSESDIVSQFVKKYELSNRESEVLSYLSMGRTRVYIAEELGLSPNTIKGYIHNLYQKCDVSTKQELLDKLHNNAGRQ